MEPLFGATVAQLAIADVLLVCAAEAYINAVAAHVLKANDLEQFEKLSPVGKWSFLPRLMGLKWRPSVSRGCLQTFAQMVSRRNRVVHPRVVQVDNATQVARFITQMRLDGRSTIAGVDAVRELIKQLSLSWRGSHGPDWLNPATVAARPPCFTFGPIDGSMRFVGHRGEMKRHSKHTSNRGHPSH